MKKVCLQTTFLTVLIVLLSASVACRKDDISSGPSIRTELCLTTQHHEQILPNITIYLKYFADTFPGYTDLTVYDTVFTTDQWGYRCYQGLPFGKHWLTGVGVDSFLNEPVRGSVQVEMGFSAAIKDTILYVSEY